MLGPICIIVLVQMVMLSIVIRLVFPFFCNILCISCRPYWKGQMPAARFFPENCQCSLKRVQDVWHMNVWTYWCASILTVSKYLKIITIINSWFALYVYLHTSFDKSVIEKPTIYNNFCFTSLKPLHTLCAKHTEKNCVYNIPFKICGVG